MATTLITVDMGSLSSGLHTITIEHVSGSAMDLSGVAVEPGYATAEAVTGVGSVAGVTARGGVIARPPAVSGAGSAAVVAFTASANAVAAPIQGTGVIGDADFAAGEGAPLRESAGNKWRPIRFRASGVVAHIRRS